MQASQPLASGAADAVSTGSSYGRGSSRLSRALRSRQTHHFSQHLPLDMLRLGPARGYWCYSYEGYNKVIKKITKGSNFKNICKRVADVW